MFVDPADVAALVERETGIRPDRIEVVREFGDHMVWRAGDFIVKCGHRDAFGLEAWACERARGVGVPTTRVVALGSDALPAPYGILEPVGGLSLADERVTREMRRSALVDAGRALRALHEIRLPRFGWVDVKHFRATGEIRGRNGSWLAEIHSELGWGLERITADAALDNREIAVLHAARDRVRPWLEGIDDGRLLHGDLSVGHLFVDPDTGEFTGLIDWGDLQVGDPLWDVAVLSSWIPAAVPAFLEGYEPDEGFLDRLTELLPFYRAYRHVWGYRWGAEHDQDEAPRLAILRALIAELR